MARPVTLFAFVLAAFALTTAARAFHDELPGHREAAAAAFVELLPDWNVRGACGSLSDETPAANDVCYRRAQRYGDGAYVVYSAHALAAVDGDWWAGIQQLNDGWQAYRAGRCDFFYCRIAAPDGEVLEGYPNGDVDCDGDATSLDALFILQVIAALLERAQLQCDDAMDVDPRDPLNAVDALAILQSSAGLIGGLPIVLDDELIRS